MSYGCRVAFLEVFISSRSIVLVATRGQSGELVNIAPHLVSLGVAKDPDLHSKG